MILKLCAIAFHFAGTHVLFNSDIEQYWQINPRMHAFNTVLVFQSNIYSL